MSLSSHAARLRRVAWLVGAVALAVLLQWSSWSAPAVARAPHATHRAHTRPAPAGAEAVYQQNADGSYGRPAGVRSTLSATASGWQLVTPDQLTYSFDATGRLTSIKNTRGLGTTVAYVSATQWTITDAAGRVVTV